MLSVSIPQAVSTVATDCSIAANICLSCFRFNTASGKYCCNEDESLYTHKSVNGGFNTASGKYCCNEETHYDYKRSFYGNVSIPQAVSTVATAESKKMEGGAQSYTVSIPQAVSTVATFQLLRPCF